MQPPPRPLLLVRLCVGEEWTRVKIVPLSSLPPRPTHLFLTLFRMGEGKEEGNFFFWGGGRRVKTFSLTFSFSLGKRYSFTKKHEGKENIFVSLNEVHASVMGREK